ncbi:drug/metabolite transporter (DMT)-like permease [Clostridium algifaecis]|uniref:Drug/metabolite transporter (DMT)-like permease n=1 Tax=Clostridium algifaecis TaxID=1472040 RepID=A0ABS4KRE1_9CLOT|nr:DMT family transporter [Clostridium algifaecis]MBP2032613.1 drug/metabolite transporter (DMT)-like permease [Clostridium algifaecis]
MKKGYIYSVLSAILFGTCGIIIKIAFAEGADSINILILQYMVSIPIIFLSILITDKNALKIKKSDLCHTAVLGIVGNTFMTVFYYMSFNYLDVSMVTILLYTYPAMVFIYYAIFEKIKIGFNKVFDLAAAFTGCFLALGLTNGIKSFSIKGFACGILAAIFYAFMNIYTEKKMTKINSLTVNFYSIIFSFLSLIIFKSPMKAFEQNLSIKLIICIVILAVVCEIIPLTLLYSAIKNIGPLKVSIIGNLEIPTAMLLSFFILKEPLTLLQVFGAALVIYAVYNIRKID